MTDLEIENELIKVFTSSNIRKIISEYEDGFIVDWLEYTLYMEVSENQLRIMINNQDYSLSLKPQTIPTKALAILAITCRPAYEFYRKHWLK